MPSKRSPKPTTSTTGPINVALPNTVDRKMEAIANLAVAVRNLSEALSSTNVQVTISGNVISGAATGIYLSHA